MHELSSDTEPMYCLRGVRAVSFHSKLSRLDGAGSSFSARAQVLDDLRSRIQAVLERAALRHDEPPRPTEPIDLPFATIEAPRGLLHVRTQQLSLNHSTGRVPVAWGREASAELLALLALDPRLAGCDPSRALFLDTETTGLAGGAGTVAFLVGMGWWRDRAFVVEQMLVRTLGEEGPVLAQLAERIEQASMLVTFNGKSFDLPLLRTRFVMERMALPQEPPHLDLLHVARRVHRWRVSQGSCRLVAIEREVLGFERHDDIESRDVSACYWHFLRTGDARALLGVIEHNAWDVVAMAALVGLYGEPLQGDLPAPDLAGVARTLHRAGALEKAMAMAEAAVARAAGAESIRVRAEIAKARGDRAQALADFETLAAAVDDPAVRLELAKLYEHWVKEPARALEWVMRGTGEPAERVQRRADRLARKAAKQSNRTSSGRR
jgi:uncharacterized protein YprB with RNaseH-like and TPR domain